MHRHLPWINLIVDLGQHGQMVHDPEKFVTVGGISLTPMDPGKVYSLKYTPRENGLTCVEMVMSDIK